MVAVVDGFLVVVSTKSLVVDFAVGGVIHALIFITSLDANIIIVKLIYLRKNRRF